MIFVSLRLAKWSNLGNQILKNFQKQRNQTYTV